MGRSKFDIRFTYRAASMLVVVVMIMIFCSMCVAPELQQPVPSKANVSGMMLALSLEQLVEQADMILTGTVTGIETRGGPGSKIIYSNAVIAVDQVFKGQPGATTITVKVLGGTVDGVTQAVEDVASFRQNEKVLLFLKLNSDNTAAVVGNLQGKGIIENGKISSVVASINKLSLAELLTRIEALKK